MCLYNLLGFHNIGADESHVELELPFSPIWTLRFVHIFNIMFSFAVAACSP